MTSLEHKELDHYRPSDREFCSILDKRLLPNCPFTSKDVKLAAKMLGPDIGTLKGKTVRKRPMQVDASLMIDVPIPKKYHDVVLCMDVLHVNGIPFLATISRFIKFGTITALKALNGPTLFTAIKQVASIYRRGNLRPRILLADGAFDNEPMNEFLHGIGMSLNPTSRDEHVSDIERYIRTIKERMRCMYNTLPFKHMPKVLVIEMAKAAVYWLNAFPAFNGISDEQSPKTLVTGQQLDYNRHCKYEFGQYVQTHEPHDNSMEPRTQGALALRPTGNQQGGHYFLNLLSGRVINRNHATIVPMPDIALQRVHQLAVAQEAYPNLAFGDRDNRILALEYNDFDEGNDEDYEYDVDDEDDVLRYDEDIVDNELATVNEDPVEELVMEDVAAMGNENDYDLNDQEIGEDQGLDGPEVGEDQGLDGPEDGDNVGLGLDLNGPVDGVVEGGGNDDGVQEGIDIDAHEEQLHADYVEQAVADQELIEENQGVEANQGVEPVPNQGVGPQPEQPPMQQPNIQGVGGGIVGGGGDAVAALIHPRYNLRTNRERNYAHRYNNDIYVTAEVAQDVSTPQMGMKQGVRLFGDAGVAAVKKEVLQLHDREVMRAIMKSSLTKQQIRQALGYLMFLKRKRTGKIKGRGCADGRKQREYINKEDASSPTVATEAVFLSAIIDAMERRAVAVVDIPGAFMQAMMDPGVHMRITGLMVELLLEIDEKMYRPFVVVEKGEPVIYVELLRALYGTLRAARLFWEKLTAVIKEWGFIVNPYDSCVANKTINGSQCTITWHIDDLKISHKEESVVSSIIEQIQATFGQQGELSISRGKRHDYLGMYLDYSEPGQLIVDMRTAIQSIIDDVPKEFKGVAQTPAASHLFNLQDGAEQLDSDQADQFHSFTMRLMYIAQRGRPDIRAAVAFLSTRVKEPTKDDWRKLSRVMKYLQTTPDLLLRLNCDGTGILRWWVDASYAVHPNMRGHTGGVMMMGKGAAMSISSKQKLVARSSTESELIGVHDAMPNMLWCRQFLIAQGYQVREMKLFQDNMSAMLLEKNGRASSSKRTKHIDIRYFFIKDRVDNKELTIEHCPTEEMIADFHTKPLQGNLFYKFRELIMNIPSTDIYHSSRRSVLRQDSTPKETQDQTATPKRVQWMTNPKEAEWQVVQPRKRHSHSKSEEAQQNAHSF